jgi:hypothetical protein
MRLSAETIGRLWRPPAFETNRLARTLYRGWLVSVPLSLAALPIILLGFGLGVLAHRWVISVRVLVDLIAIGLFAPIFRQALGVSLTLERGYWTRKGVPVTRREEPSRYWFWICAGAVPTAVYTAAATYLFVVGATIG